MLLDAGIVVMRLFVICLGLLFAAGLAMGAIEKAHNWYDYAYISGWL